MKQQTCDFINGRCNACEGGTSPLSPHKADEKLKPLNDWQREDKTIVKTFTFKNFYETIAFVNAVAWIANGEDHHPDLTVSYNKCQIRFTTHAIDGLSDNDFICAAKIDAIWKMENA